MTWRIKVVFKDANEKMIYESTGYLRDKNGNIYGFATKDECHKAIKLLENGYFLHYKGLLEPAEI